MSIERPPPPLPQQDPGTLEQRPWDVVVTGAGPAGCIVARQLALDGHGVLLVERHRFPRDKACGDALIPDAVRSLRRTGLHDRVAALAHPAAVARISSPSRHQVDVPGEFLLIKRRLLDAELATAAVEAGVTLCVGKVSRIAEAHDTVLVDLGEAKARARFAVIATGASVVLARGCGLATRERASAVALRRYVRSEARIPELLIAYDRAVIPGYGWIFPVGGDEYNVGCGIVVDESGQPAANLRALFDAFMHEVPEARELDALRIAEPSPQRGAPLRCGLTGCRAWNGGRILVAGETLGATFPFTFEGIGKAMETAELAAASLHHALLADDRASLADYAARLDSELGPRYRGYEAAQRWLGIAWLNDLLARRARNSRYLREALAAMLREDRDPRAAFSVRGFARSFVQ
jgi:menaquinone-9 beta-reductase